MLKVKNMLSPNTGREVANQFIIESENEIVFQSYSSVIAVYDKECKCLELGIDWDYSRTTMKYLSMFIYEVLGIKLNKKEIELRIANADFIYNPRLI